MKNLILCFIVVLFASCGARKSNVSISESKTEETKTENTQTTTQNDITSESASETYNETFEWDLVVTPVDSTKEVTITKPDGQVVKFTNATINLSKKDTKHSDKKTEKLSDKSTVTEYTQSDYSKKTEERTKVKETKRDADWYFWIVLLLIAAFIYYVIRTINKHNNTV